MLVFEGKHTSSHAHTYTACLHTLYTHIHTHLLTPHTYTQRTCSICTHTRTAHTRHTCTPAAHYHTQRTHMPLFRMSPLSLETGFSLGKGSSQEVGPSQPAHTRTWGVKRPRLECTPAAALGHAEGGGGRGCGAVECSEAEEGGHAEADRRHQDPSGWDKLRTCG